MMARMILALLMVVFCVHPVFAGDPVAGKEASITCQACHGADGNGIDPTYPRLAGQYASYLEHALKAYRSGERQNAIMMGFAINLTDEQIADLSAYYASLEGLTDLSIK